MSATGLCFMPSGRAKYSVPTGLQIVDRTYCDADVLRAAMAYETAQGQWFRSRETRPR